MRHPTNTKKGLLLLLAFMFPLGSLLAQGQLIVRVFEDATNAALQGATVEIEALDIREATDNSGRVVLRNLPDGEYTVEVSYRGLPDSSEIVTVSGDAPTALPIRMGFDEEVFELTDFVMRDTVTSTDIAQQVERNALNVKDIIASDTMGQVPDRTVADAVRRLPGISVERDGGQPQNEYVTIRGLYSDFNRVSVDGVAITISNSDGASRSVPLNVISSSAADTIEVTKAVTPDMDADAIGGSINIRTKNAFDYGERNISVEFGASYTELESDFSGDLPYDQINPFFNVSYSDFIGEEQTIGFNFSANYSKDLYAVSEVNGNRYSEEGGLYFPESVDLSEVFEEVERYGINASGEWRPDDFTKLTAKYSFSRTETKFERQRLSFFNTDVPFGGAEDDGENFTRYTYDGFIDKNASYFEDEQDVHVFSISGEKELDEWTVSGALGLNYSVYEEDPDESFRGTFSQFSSRDFIYTNGGGYTPVIESPQRDIEYPTIYDFLLNGADSLYKEIEDTEFSFSGDAERGIEIGGRQFDVKLGGKARFRTRDFDDLGDSFFDPFDDFGTDLSGDSRLDTLVADYSVDSRVDGRYPGGFYWNPRAFRDYVRTLESEGTVINDPRDDLFNLNNSFEVDENIYAAYAQASTEFGKFTLLAGVRVEFTDIEFRANDVILPSFDDFDPAVDYVSDRTDKNDYVDVLPGVFLRYDYSDELILRASLNKTLARASYRQLNPAERREPVGLSGVRDEVTRGDTDLDPTESWNFDLSADYYYSPSGYASLGLFAKYMENNIYEITRDVPTGTPGIVDEVTETFNADYATVFGLEFIVDQQFSALPSFFSNLGASLNVTLTDSEVETDLVARPSKTDLFGQVSKAVNASLYYEGAKFRSRLSYNWTDEYLLIGGLDELDPNLDEYADDFGTFDFTMGYYITDDIELFFEARNITDEANRGFVGDDSRLLFNSYSGRTFFVGASWNL